MMTKKQHDLHEGNLWEPPIQGEMDGPWELFQRHSKEGGYQDISTSNLLWAYQEQLRNTDIEELIREADEMAKRTDLIPGELESFRHAVVLMTGAQLIQRLKCGIN